MNIADKKRFLSEIARVLKVGGRFVFHDIFQGEGGEPHYPLPWADDPSISFLATAASMQESLREAGLYHSLLGGQKPTITGLVCRRDRKTEEIRASTPGASPLDGRKRETQVPESNSQSSGEANCDHSGGGEKRRRNTFT